MRPEAGRASSLLALACIALALLPDSVSASLAFEREALCSEQWWRMWTGHLVHFGLEHALGDAAVVFVCGAFLERRIGARRLVPRLLLAAPLISLVLLLAAPGMLEYRGASALATMLAAMTAIVLHAQRHWRPALLACAAAFGLWTLAQAQGVGVNLAGLPLGVGIAWQAHLAGAACALLLRPDLRPALASRYQATEYQTSRHES